MQRSKVNFLFLNVGHFLDHLFMLVFATAAALQLSTKWGMSYAELVPYATPGFVAFGLCAIPAGWLGLDIGSKSIEKFRDILKGTKTVVWNGPMGVFEIEAVAKGTYAVAEMIAEATANGAITVIGGGDSASAVTKSGVADKVSHVSTGGGASLEFIEGKILPGVAALTDKEFGAPS